MPAKSKGPLPQQPASKGAPQGRSPAPQPFPSIRPRLPLHPPHNAPNRASLVSLNVPRTPHSTVRLGAWHPAFTSTIPYARHITKHTDICHGDDNDRLVPRYRGASRRSARDGPGHKHTAETGNLKSTGWILPRRETIQQVKRPGSCVARGAGALRGGPSGSLIRMTLPTRNVQSRPAAARDTSAAVPTHSRRWHPQR